MEISVTQAKGQLTDLVRRAEAGDEIILTRHGHPAVRLIAITPVVTAASRKALLASLRRSAAASVSDGPAATRSQDFLYNENGLPE